MNKVRYQKNHNNIIMNLAFIPIITLYNITHTGCYKKAKSQYVLGALLCDFLNLSIFRSRV